MLWRPSSATKRESLCETKPMTNPGEPKEVVQIRRLLPATPEVVFSAWTDPDSLSHWISPYGKASVTLDLRVGGTFEIIMKGKDEEIAHTGEYREIDPPNRLVFTWQSEYTGPNPTLVTVSLRRLGNQTELTLIHELLPRERVESHEGGWSLIIERLYGLLSNTSQPAEGG